MVEYLFGKQDTIGSIPSSGFFFIETSMRQYVMNEPLSPLNTKCLVRICAGKDAQWVWYGRLISHSTDKHTFGRQRKQREQFFTPQKDRPNKKVMHETQN